MRIVVPEFVIETDIHAPELLCRIERYGRTCYKSENKITDSSAPEFVRRLICLGHESVLEHESITMRIICDRGVSHELVRHRITSYSQESTRYCDYAKPGQESEIRVIAPPLPTTDHNAAGTTSFDCWWMAMQRAELDYRDLRARGIPPEIARSVLPHALKTEIVMTANLREWRHVFRLRALNPKAHPQMREIMCPLLAEFQRLIPVVFDDLEVTDDRG